MVKIILIVGVVAVVALFGAYFLRNKLGSSASNVSAKVEPSAIAASASPDDSDTSENDVYKVATDPKKGQYLTDMSGNALYTSDEDKLNASSCDSDCAKTWKPYSEDAKPETKPEENVKVKPTDVTVKQENVKVKPTDINVKPEKIKVKPTNVTTFKRYDGTSQYAYKGHALYHYSGDKKSTDITGDGIGGTWHVAKP